VDLGPTGVAGDLVVVAVPERLDGVRQARDAPLHGQLADLVADLPQAAFPVEGAGVDGPVLDRSTGDLGDGLKLQLSAQFARVDDVDIRRLGTRY